MLLVDRAYHGALLTGHYTVDGLNHLGPFFIYFRYFAEVLVGPYVGSRFGADLLGTMAAVSLFAGLMGATLFRLARGRSAVAASVTASVLVLIQLVGHTDILATLLMSEVVVLPFLTFLTTAVLLLQGSLFALIAATFCAGALCHGYIPLVPVVGAVWLVALVGGRCRRIRETGRDFPRAAWLAVGLIIAAFLAPILLDIVVNPPGNIVKVFFDATQGPDAQHPPIREIYDFMISRGLGLRYFLWLVILAGLFLSLGSGPSRSLWRDVGLVIVVAGLATLLFYLHTPGSLRWHSGRFLIALPLLALAVACLILIQALGRYRPWLTVPLAAWAVVLFAAFLSLTRADGYRWDGLRVFSNAVAAGNPAGNPVEIDTDAEPPYLIAVASALMVDLERIKIHACHPDPAKANFFTPEHICPPGGAATRFLVTSLGPCGQSLSEEEQALRGLSPLARTMIHGLDGLFPSPVFNGLLEQSAPRFEGWAPTSPRPVPACKPPDGMIAHGCRPSECFGLRKLP